MIAPHCSVALTTIMGFELPPNEGIGAMKRRISFWGILGWLIVAGMIGRSVVAFMESPRMAKALEEQRTPTVFVAH